MSKNVNPDTTTNSRPSLSISLQTFIEVLEMNKCPYTIEEAQGDGTDFKHCYGVINKGDIIVRTSAPLGWIFPAEQIDNKNWVKNLIFDEDNKKEG